MPPKAKRPCRSPMCPAKTQNASGYCSTHIHLASGWNAPGRKTAEDRGYGTHWRRIRRQVLERDRHMCMCDDCKGRRLPASEVDHKVPKSAGGTDDFSNLQAMNDVCHRLKTQAEAAKARG